MTRSGCTCGWVWADRDTPGVTDALDAMPAMAQYLATAVTPPSQVDSRGAVTDANSPVGFSAALYPYLIAVGRRQEAQRQMDRVDASVDPASGLYGRDGQYYDQNLILFATGWKDGRFRFDRNGRLKLRWH